MTATGSEPITLDNLKAFKKEFVDGASGSGNTGFVSSEGTNGVFYRYGNVVEYVFKNNTYLDLSSNGTTNVENTIPLGYIPISPAYNEIQKSISVIGGTASNSRSYSGIVRIAQNIGIKISWPTGTSLESHRMSGKSFMWITNDEMPTS